MNISEREEAPAAFENEPIQIPGAIQEFGVLLCMDKDLHTVQQVSSNVTQLLNRSVDACLGATGPQLLGELLVDQLRSALQGHDKMNGAFIAVLGSGDKQKRAYVTAYRSGGSVVVELEPAEAEPVGVLPERYQLPAVNDWLDVITRSQSPTELLDNLVGAIEFFSAYDRVLVYKFDSDFNGEVVAESRADFLPPFLGHHFPAHDISPQARAMYQYNAVRVIADSHGIPTPLVPQSNPETGLPLDLSLGALRAVPPIDQQYLQNMEVGSAVSIAIFSDTGLWGIVACHSQTPKVMPLSVRESAAALTQIASQRLFLLHARAEVRYRRAIQNHRESFVARINSEAPDQLLRDLAATWRDLFNACGLAFSHRGSLYREGKTPMPEDISSLTDWLETQVSGLALWVSDSLIESGYRGNIDMSCGCGVLAIPVTNEPTGRSWLMFFRPEMKRTIDWSGKPKGTIAGVQNQSELSPPRSFATWQEVIEGASEPWQPAEQLAIRDLGNDLMVGILAHEITRLNTDLQREQEALAEANERLQHLVLTDPLTGTGNRQKVENEIDAALNNARRHGNIFSLLLFDIDKFKNFNDTYGHNLGDQVLKCVVQRVNECLREPDTLGRWGGEEFIVLMPSTDCAGAQILAERLRKHVEATDFGLNENITVSIGVACWQPDDDRTMLVARADGAMYEAKESGRNRVCVNNTYEN